MNSTGNYSKIFFTLGSLSAGIAVAGGAFGAHALKGAISTEMLALFETAARYQMYQSIGLLATAWAINRRNGEGVRGYSLAGWLFAGGIVLFSGSLYALATTGQRWLGAVTPFGGLAFVIGWTLLAWNSWRNPHPPAG